MEMIMDSYWKRRLIVTMLLAVCAGLSILADHLDPEKKSWIGQSGAEIIILVFPLFIAYAYFWWKGYQERKNQNKK